MGEGSEDGVPDSIATQQKLTGTDFFCMFNAVKKMVSKIDLVLFRW